MKKVIVLLCVILAATLVACGYSDEDLSAAQSEGYRTGYSEGYNNGYDEGYNDGYRKGFNERKPVSKPASGTILSGEEYSGSELTIIASDNNDYVVSLKDEYGTHYLSFYVRAGDTVTVGVPSEYLYVYFASGTQWYGYGKGLMFGEDTQYTRDDELRDFVEYTWEYTLYPVNDGNFSESPSTEGEFF